MRGGSCRLQNEDVGDLDIINAARLTAEDAEMNTGGLDDTIGVAGADTVAGKVFKLEFEMLGMQTDQA